MAGAPKKKYARWILLFAVTGIVDVAQILIDLTGVGIIVSEAIETVMPFVIAGILLVFGLLNMQTGMSIVIAVVTDAATGGFAPFWIADAWYIYRKVRAQEAAIAAAEDTETESPGPLYQNGVRAPSRQRAPLNSGGARRPAVNVAATPTDQAPQKSINTAQYLGQKYDTDQSTEETMATNPQPFSETDEISRGDAQAA
ncbi:MAG TPA: hypothetical protein VF438_00930 [Candidatus Paceibacterota bacterium]